MRLNPDGFGQALIFPYYTVQSAGGNPFNTYLSVVNVTGAAKAIRVRFREGRMGAEALSFNLFLSPNDTWTAALIPQGDGTRLITADPSCTDGLQPGVGGGPSFADFRNTAFSGANDDGAGAGLDRTREGFVEMIEMATLTGASATAVTHTVAGVPANCAVVQGAATLEVTAPSGVLAPGAASAGGPLTGGLTLINVTNGMDFTTNATALADLASHPFYRPATDPYPDLNAAEIDPVSTVIANGALYRSTWSRPVDAVSAVFMSTTVYGEYVLDQETGSNTDMVATFPTRRFYLSGTTLRPPFTMGSAPPPNCGTLDFNAENVVTVAFNRDEAGIAISSATFEPIPAGFITNTICAATVVMDVTNGKAHTTVQAGTRVLGSLTRGYSRKAIELDSTFTHGWMRTTFIANAAAQQGLGSLPSSTRTDLATGAVTTGAQTYFGLPVVGFTARTFVNGTLACSAGACQGNYGGLFPFQYFRSVFP